jgi:hypothetical protein
MQDTLASRLVGPDPLERPLASRGAAGPLGRRDEDLRGPGPALGGLPTQPGAADAGTRRGPFVRARTGTCGVPVWSLEPLRGRGGTPGASWCPHAARAEAEPPSSRAENSASLDEVLAAWRRARRGRDDLWHLSPRDEVFAAAPGWPHALQLLEVMLREGARVQVVTRAGRSQAEGLVALAARSRGRLSVRIGLMGGPSDAEARWEPGLAPRSDRLALAEALVGAGVDVSVELGPVVPFVNDDPRHWQGLMRALSRIGVRRLVPRFIAGDWALIHRLERVLSPAEGRMVMGWLGLGRGKAGSDGLLGRPGFSLSASARATRLDRLQGCVGELPVALAVCRCLTEGTRATGCDTEARPARTATGGETGTTPSGSSTRARAAPRMATPEAVQGDLFSGLTRGERARAAD